MTDAERTDTPQNDQTGGASNLMTQAEYARHMNVTRQYVSKLVKQERLPMVGDKIEVAQADLALGKIPRDEVDANRDTDQNIPPSYNDAVRRRAEAEASLAELKLRKLDGTLVEKDEAVRATTEIFGEMRDRLTEFPVRIAGKVRAQKTEREVAAVIRDEIEAELTNFSLTLRQRLGVEPEAISKPVPTPQPPTDAGPSDESEHISPVDRVSGAGGDDGSSAGVDATAAPQLEPMGSRREDSTG